MGAFTWSQSNAALANFPAPNAPQGVEGGYAWVQGQLVGSTSYATGGDTLDPEVQLGLSVVEFVAVFGNVFASGYALELAGTVNVPLIKVKTAILTEVANGTNIATSTWTVRSSGKR